MRSRTHLLLSLALLTLASGTVLATQGDIHEVKAAFLYNFTLFTEWPGERGELTICILGRSSFGDELARYVGREANGRKVSIRVAASVREAQTCQVLFIADSEHPQLTRIQQELGRSPVLTVTDANGFDHRNAMIVLTPAQGRIAFEVNQTAARETGLKFSSKLLRLARKVY